MQIPSIEEGKWSSIQIENSNLVALSRSVVTLR